MNTDIRARHVELSDELRAHAERRLRSALKRLDRPILRVRMWLTDLNGPKGGVDKHCRIEVAGRAGTVVVEDTNADAYVVIDLATERVRRAARRLADRAKCIDRALSPRVLSWPTADGRTRTSRASWTRGESGMSQATQLSLPRKDI